jgi:Phosphoesterase family
MDLPVTNGVSAHQESCHVPLFVIYPYTSADTADGTFFDHYSITKTVEEIFGLPYLAHARDAQTSSLIGHFGLASGSPSPSPSPSPSTSPTTSPSPSPSASPSPSPSPTPTTTVTSCPPMPGGSTELSGNVSLETGQTGWTGVYTSGSAVTRIQPTGGSYDGGWALQIAPKAGGSGTAGVNNVNPIWVPGPPGESTTTGATYTGSVFVRASAVGETVSLLVRETTTSGSGLGYHTTTRTLPDTAWHQISSAYTAKNSGDLIRYSLYVSNFASSGQYLLADCLSLQQ